MNRYQELTDYLFNLRTPEELKTDLAEPLALGEKLGHPEKSFRSIHIAGTNRKGSVAVKIAEVLKRNGLKVGLFTSPHLFSYCERIQINGQMISEEKVSEGLEKILPLTTKPKFFEITTLLAFDYFAKEKVDIAVIEAGVGGRLDATNIITPILSVITTVDKDHTQALGTTRNQIAYEKAGIIKPAIPVVIGERADLAPIRQRAEDLECSLIKTSGESSAIAKAALEILPFSLKHFEGLEVNPPCRYQKHGDIIFDVAHNPMALKNLFERVKKDYPDRKIHVLLGMSRDKDIQGSFRVLQQYADHITLLPPIYKRLMEPVGFPAGTPLTPQEGLDLARRSGAIAIVTGSFYIMSLFKDHLNLSA